MIRAFIVATAIFGWAMLLAYLWAADPFLWGAP